jgi:hypothetical protein
VPTRIDDPLQIKVDLPTGQDLGLIIHFEQSLEVANDGDTAAESSRVGVQPTCSIGSRCVGTPKAQRVV